MTESVVAGLTTLLEGQCILVVEDEMLLAMMLEDMLTDLGYRTLKVARLAKAVELAETAMVDCAIIDVNLDRDTSYPVAEALRLRDIPFIFSTGYGPAGLQAEFRDYPILSKPYSQEELQRILAKTLALHILKT